MDSFKFHSIISAIKAEVDLNYDKILKVYLSEEATIFANKNLHEDENLELMLGLKVELNPNIEGDYLIVYEDDSPLIGVKKEIKFNFLKDVMKKDPTKYTKALNESICPHCNKKRRLTLEHQNCSYVEEHKNYYLACDECHSYIYQKFEEMWEDVVNYG